MESFYTQLGKSRQLYRKLSIQNKSKTETEKRVLDLVRAWRIDHPKMGSRSLYRSMEEAGEDLPIGVTAFERLLSRSNLTVGVARRNGPYTSDGKGRGNYPNLANGLLINDINQIVVADITYYYLVDDWCYLFVLKDVYSQRLISLLPSRNMKAENAKLTLEELSKIRGEDMLTNCIHHSDNVSQYESTLFRKKLATLSMRISRASSCQQNGSSEQCNHIIKNMYLKNYGIRTFTDLQYACHKVKRLMNTERSVKQLGYQTVQKFEDSLEAIPLENRKVKELYDFNDS